MGAVPSRLIEIRSNDPAEREDRKRRLMCKVFKAAPTETRLVGPPWVRQDRTGDCEVTR